MIAAIETRSLTKTYGKNRGIRDLNLCVNEGEIFGFLGPNGAGKSTALRTMAGFMFPTSGESRILGINPHTDHVAAMQKIGNLPTEFSLDDRMSGRKLISLFARMRGLSDISYAEELAKRIDADLDRPMRRLSRGNKQKIGIVQAMFHRPPVVILDEPTGGLDPLIQDTFLHILTEARDSGQTIIFSSHVLSEIERVADRVGIIREGELVAIEDPHELTERAIRRVHIRFEAPISPQFLDQLHHLDGITDIVADGTSLRVTLQRDPNALLALVTPLPIVTIDIERPSLEEIFLTFYGPGAKAGTP